MTDLEMTKLCAEAMGYAACRAHIEDYDKIAGYRFEVSNPLTGWALYDPLNDDAQAMALVKKFRLTIYGMNRTEDEWAIFNQYRDSCWAHTTFGSDLNRAIVECVAKMQQAKAK